MTDLTDFIRREHKPLARRAASLAADKTLLVQDIAGVEGVFDRLGVPRRDSSGNLLRPTGRALALERVLAEFDEQLQQIDDQLSVIVALRQAGGR